MEDKFYPEKAYRLNNFFILFFYFFSVSGQRTNCLLGLDPVWRQWIQTLSLRQFFILLLEDICISFPSSASMSHGENCCDLICGFQACQHFSQTQSHRLHLEPAGRSRQTRVSLHYLLLEKIPFYSGKLITNY